MQTEKLLLPRWIIPLEGKTEVLENYGLAIENGRIAALIPPSDLENVEAKEVFELPDSVVMPGFVNCHTHASMNLLRWPRSHHTELAHKMHLAYRGTADESGVRLRRRSSRRR